MWKKKEKRAFDKAGMQATLLYGEYCTVWKVQDPLTRKMNSDKDILSSRYSIEKANKEAEEEAEEEVETEEKLGKWL